MKSQLKIQLGILLLAVGYFLSRLVNPTTLNWSIWQRVYFGNFIKDTGILALSLLLIYYIFNNIRRNPQIGPTIISAVKIKQVLIFGIILSWLAAINHMIFDSLKIIFPFHHLPLYQFANFLDETISHIFMFLPTIIFISLITFFEIQRPEQQKVSNKETWLIIINSIILGIFWGFNLSEGRLSLYTAFPLMIFYFLFFMFLNKKYQLSLKNLPFSLFGLIGSVSGSISFIVYNLIFKSSTELFSLFV
ncbi:hypothetical protein ACFL18_01070 [Patescibacteria group bacterium]